MNVIVIDALELANKLNEECNNDPMVHKFIHLLMHGDRFDTTDLFAQLISMQSKTNRDLLAKCIKLSMNTATLSELL